MFNMDTLFKYMYNMPVVAASQEQTAKTDWYSPYFARRIYFE